MNNPIIVALDGMKYQDALDLAKKLQGKVWGFKVNDLAYSMNLERHLPELAEYGKLMFDLKLHDIPNTVKNYCDKIGKWPVDIVTIHASGGWEMISAASHALPGKIAAVTVLTSLNDTICKSIYHDAVLDQVQTLCAIAQNAGAHYVVCSPEELEKLRYNVIKKITPGIRPVWYEASDDQKRVSTPVEAIKAGASFLVIGRPITKSEDPVAAAEKTLAEINGG